MKSALRRPSWTWRLVALLPLAVDDEHPVAAGVVEEGAVRDQQRLRRIAERQLGLDGLAALDRGRLRRRSNTRSIWNWPLRTCG